MKVCTSDISWKLILEQTVYTFSRNLIGFRFILVSKCLSGDCPSYLILNDIVLKSNRDILSKNSRYVSTNLVCHIDILHKISMVCPRFPREAEGGRSFAVSVSGL